MSRSLWIAAAALAAVALLSSFAAAPAHAQIVNVQGQLAKAAAEDGVAGQVEAKLDWRTGNNPLFDAGAAGSVVMRRGRLLALALAQGGYGTSRGLTLTRRSFEHLRARVTLDPRWWRWEAFGQHEYDAFRRLLMRAVVGSGPALQIVQRPSFALLAGAAYMLELERLDRRAGASDAGDRSLSHRASLYLTGTEALGEGVSIGQTVYVQPRIDDPRDVRVLAEASVTSKLTRNVALSDSLTVAYDRTPPDGIERLDTQLRVSVIVTF